jgi:aminopeptidase C
MWQKLTHATLLIGWGYDEATDMKYWLVRNSYGSSWGERGNFKVRRGQNDYGCEGEIMAATPVLL